MGNEKLLQASLTLTLTREAHDVHANGDVLGAVISGIEALQNKRLPESPLKFQLSEHPSGLLIEFWLAGDAFQRRARFAQDLTLGQGGKLETFTFECTADENGFELMSAVREPMTRAAQGYHV